MSPSRCQSLGRTQGLCRFLQFSATYWKRVDFPEATKYTFLGGGLLFRPPEVQEEVGRSIAFWEVRRGLAAGAPQLTGSQGFSEAQS